MGKVADASTNVERYVHRGWIGCSALLLSLLLPLRADALAVAAELLAVAVAAVAVAARGAVARCIIRSSERASENHKLML